MSQRMQTPLSIARLSDREAIERAFATQGKHLMKNYYGLPIDPTEPGWDKLPVSIEDFNMDGAMGMHVEFKKSLDENNGDVLKTLGATSAATLVMVPTVISQPAPMIDLVKRHAPFLAMLAKPMAVGKTVHITRRTTGISQTWGDGDGGALTGADQVFAEKTADMAYLYSPGSISWPAQKLSERTLNLYAESVRGHMLDHMQYKEKVMLRAFNTGASGVASKIDLSATASSIHGALPELEDYNSSSNLIDLAGARKIHLSDLDTNYQVIEEAGGQVTATFVDRTTYTDLRNEAKAALRTTPESANRYGFGLDSFFYDQKPVIWTAQLSSTTGEKAALTLDMRAVAEFPLLNEEIVRVAQQMADKQEFFIRNYFTFKLHTPEWCRAVVDAL